MTFPLPGAGPVLKRNVMPPVFIGPPNGVNDAPAINAVISQPGGTAQLQAASLNNPYIIKDPGLIFASQSRLWGSVRAAASNQDSYGAGTGASTGTVIFVDPSFSSPAALSLVNSAPGVQNYGVDIANITIEGFSVGHAGTNCMLVQGAWGASYLTGCCFHRTPGDLVVFQVDPGTGFVPDSWYVIGNKFSASRTGRGLFAPNFPDSQVLFNEFSENVSDNAVFGACVNTRVGFNRFENGGASGARFVGLGAGQEMYIYGNSTNLNNGDGYLFDNSGGGAAGVYNSVANTSCNDGQAGGTTFAGFRNAGSLSTIMNTACTTSVNGSGPAFGASQTAGLGMIFFNSRLRGNTSVINAAGGTNALTNNSPVTF